VSDLSNKKASTVTEPLGGVATLGGDARSGVKPVTIWATVGGALLLLQVYVWIRWISGPYFERVPGGPTDPPMYMKVMLTANAVGMCVGLPFVIWWFIIRPWVRERRITLDGLLFVSCALFFFQDPLLNYFNTWCTYNTWLWNRGSWSSHIPGWVSPESPGRQVAEPLLINATGYGMVLVLAIAGCWFMRKIKARWPGISNIRLILVTYAAAFVADFVMEAGFMLPFGLYTYPGSIRSVTVFAGTYHQWPIYEGLMWGGVMTALSCLRYFTDDRGRTVVERGLDQVRGGFARQQLVRFREFVLLLPLQRSRAMDRDALRPLAPGSPEALVLQRRHLWRRHRRALPRSLATDPHQEVRLHQHRRRAGAPRRRRATEDRPLRSRELICLPTAFRSLPNPVRWRRSTGRSTTRSRSSAPPPAEDCRCC